MPDAIVDDHSARRRADESLRRCRACRERLRAGDRVGGSAVSGPLSPARATAAGARRRPRSARQCWSAAMRWTGQGHAPWVHETRQWLVAAGAEALLLVALGLCGPLLRAPEPCVDDHRDNEDDTEPDKRGRIIKKLPKKLVHAASCARNAPLRRERTFPLSRIAHTANLADAGLATSSWERELYHLTATSPGRPPIRLPHASLASYRT